MFTNVFSPTISFFNIVGGDCMFLCGWTQQTGELVFMN